MHLERLCLEEAGEGEVLILEVEGQVAQEEVEVEVEVVVEVEAPGGEVVEAEAWIQNYQVAEGRFRD